MEQYILPEQLVRDSATHHVFLECDLVNGAFKRNRQVRQRTLVYVSAAGKRKANTTWSKVVTPSCLLTATAPATATAPLPGLVQVRSFVRSLARC